MKKDLLIAIGFIIYIVLSCVDRFIVSIPNVVYIPFMIVDIILIIIGIIIRKQIEK